MKKYDYLIVGSGMFGATFARHMLDAGKSVLIIDKRSHLGGNCFSEKREGIDVHVYGPHIFHTNDDRIWDFVNRFSKFEPFINKPKVSYKEKMYSFPVNLMTLHQLWGVKTPAEAEEKLKSVRIPCENPQNLEDWILSQVGREIYETFIEGYTKKQWGRHPKDLPASIIKRLPIRLIYEENYFTDKYQGIPAAGYTSLMENMMSGADILLDTDFFNDQGHWESIATKVVYTGKIDEFFNYVYGELEYRSLEFETFVVDGDYQGNAIVNYTEYDVPHTRIVEHKHFLPSTASRHEKSVVTREFPAKWTRDKTPYYPVRDKKNEELYNSYRELAEKKTNYIFGGRLAEYVYYDMHQVIASGMTKARKELNV
jgi:UDP-galactopyranose mutase